MPCLDANRRGDHTLNNNNNSKKTAFHFVELMGPTLKVTRFNWGDNDRHNVK